MGEFIPEHFVFLGKVAIMQDLNKWKKLVEDDGNIITIYTTNDYWDFVSGRSIPENFDTLYIATVGIKGNFVPFADIDFRWTSSFGFEEMVSMFLKKNLRLIYER